MSSVLTTNYDDPIQLAFDSGIFEIITSAKQKKRVFPNELLFNDFHAGSDLFRFTGTKTATLSGGASVVDGNLSIPAGGVAEYNGDNLLSTNKIGVEIQIIPGFTGNGTGVNYFYTEATAFSSVLLVTITANGSGTTVISVYNSSGTLIFNHGILESFTAGVPVTYGIHCDFTGGDNKLFHNGEIVLSNALTATFTGIPAFVRMGGPQTSSTSADPFSVGYIKRDSEPFRTAAHAIDLFYTDFYVNSPIISRASSINLDSISDISIAMNTTVNTDILFRVEFGSDIYWHDGTDWVISDGSDAQSNSKAEIEANISSLDVSIGDSFDLLAIFKTNGWETAELISFTLTYDEFFIKLDYPTCKLYGYILDNGSPVSGATVKIYSAVPFYINGNAISVNELISTNSKGYFEIDVPQTAQLIYEERWIDAKNKKQTDAGELLIPASSSSELEDARVVA